MSLENFGNHDGPINRALTYPVRAGARILHPSGYANDIRKEGPIGGTLDAGTRLAGRVSIETFKGATEVVGYGIGKTRDAVGRILYNTAGIGWGLAKHSPLFPMSPAFTGARTDVASTPDGTPPAPTTVQRLGQLWQETRRGA